MYQLSEQQIDFILSDIKKHGVELEDLQLNLLDHICCIIENELADGHDFETFYSNTLSRFYNHNLYELEEEALLLIKFKHYYTMKKLMLFSGIFSASSLMLGILFKFMHWPGASALIVLGIGSLCLLFLPIYFTLKIKNETLIKDKILIGITSIVCIGFSFSVLFKIQHWPGANMLGLLSIVLMFAVFLPIYFITGIRDERNKVSTIVSSVLIIAGCALFLALVRTPKASIMHMRAITAQLSNTELLYKDMSQRAALTTDSLSNELLATTNQIKTYIVSGETGKPALVNLNEETSLIGDGVAADYFIGNNEKMELLNKLQGQISAYNIRAKAQNQIQIPADAANLNMREITIQTGLNNLLLIQLIVLQNRQSAVGV